MLKSKRLTRIMSSLQSEIAMGVKENIVEKSFKSECLSEMRVKPTIFTLCKRSRCVFESEKKQFKFFFSPLVSLSSAKRVFEEARLTS